MGLLDSLSVLFVSFSRITNQTWPYVTMPDFAVRMAKILPLTDAISVNLLPIVHASDRREWEEYSVANDQWVDQGMALQDEWDGYYGPKGIYNGKKNNVLHTDFEPLPYSVR
jgi:hypothetical protein